MQTPAPSTVEAGRSGQVNFCTVASWLRNLPASLCAIEEVTMRTFANIGPRGAVTPQ